MVIVFERIFKERAKNIFSLKINRESKFTLYSFNAQIFFISNYFMVSTMIAKS